MINLEEEENKKIRALLVGAPAADISELCGLVKTLGYEIARTVILTRMEQNPVYGFGKGKAEEIAALSKELECDLIIFDFEISPRKQRNWEKLAKIPVIDRQEVILRIFASRAQTKEAVLQVQLAQLEYARPRLAHSYGDMARQRGGNFGSKGSGETQLELDIRKIREKIQQLKKELEQVVRDRETQRKRR
ncbi:MAG: GTPase HflX, partial [Treponema sp.]|nr:GTPase HflX [Treponema sp.]